MSPSLTSSSAASSALRQLFALMALMVLATSCSALEQASRLRLRTKIIDSMSSSLSLDPASRVITQPCENNAGAPRIDESMYYLLGGDDGAVLYGLGYPQIVYDRRSRNNEALYGFEAQYQPDIAVRKYPNSTTAMTTRYMHWRFVHLGEGRYHVINGASGQYLAAKVAAPACALSSTAPSVCPPPSRPYNAPAEVPDNVLVASLEPQVWTMATCYHAQFKLFNQLYMAPRKDIRRDRSGNGLSMTSNPWHEYTESDCGYACSPGWTKYYISSSACAFGIYDKMYCYRNVTLSLDQQQPTMLKLITVPVYKPADASDGPVSNVADQSRNYMEVAGTLLLKVASGATTAGTNKLNFGSNIIAGGQLVNKFGKIGTWAAKGLGVVGIGLSVVLGFLEAQQKEEELAAFETKMKDWTRQYVTEVVVQHNMQMAIGGMSVERIAFLTSYRNSKFSMFATPDLDSMDSLLISRADHANDISHNIRVALINIEPEGLIAGKIVGSPMTTALIRGGFSFYAMGVLEMMAAKQESVLMSAYRDVDKNGTYADCETLLSNVDFRRQASESLKYMKMMQEYLVKSRTDGIFVSAVFGGDLYRSIDNFMPTMSGWMGQMRRVITAGSTSRDLVQKVMEAQRRELTWDMQHFSYSMNYLEESLTALASSTIDSCNKLRDDPQSRMDFADCAKKIGDGCNF